MTDSLKIIEFINGLFLRTKACLATSY